MPELEFLWITVSFTSHAYFEIDLLLINQSGITNASFDVCFNPVCIEIALGQIYLGFSCFELPVESNTGVSTGSQSKLTVVFLYFVTMMYLIIRQLNKHFFDTLGALVSLIEFINHELHAPNVFIDKFGCQCPPAGHDVYSCVLFTC